MTLWGEGSNASSTNKESDLSRSSGERRTTHSLEWEGTQTLRRERHAHRWPSKVRGAMLARSTRSSGERRTHSSEWEGTYTLRREQHAHRWHSKVRGAMLALPTMLRREQHAHRWPTKVRGAVLVRPTRSSGEQITHSSEWECKPGPGAKMSGPPLERKCGPGVSNQRELSLAYSSNIQDAAHWGVSHPVLTVRTRDRLQSPFSPLPSSPKIHAM